MSTALRTLGSAFGKGMGASQDVAANHFAKHVPFCLCESLSRRSLRLQVAKEKEAIAEVKEYAKTATTQEEASSTAKLWCYDIGAWHTKPWPM